MKAESCRAESWSAVGDRLAQKMMSHSTIFYDMIPVE